MLTRSKKTGFIIIKKYTIALENTEINVRKLKSVNPISKGTNLTFGWFSCFLGFFLVLVTLFSTPTDNTQAYIEAKLILYVDNTFLILFPVIL